MTLYGALIGALWLALVAYWTLSARALQRIGMRWIWWRELAVRLGFFALVVVIVQLATGGGAPPDTLLPVLRASAPLGFLGFLCSLLGICLVIAARAYHGRDWIATVADQENSRLLTSGPYALVRHPIYGGLLLAMIGSAIGQSLLWLLPLIAYGPRLIVNARREERLLIERFPQGYAAYRRRTKMWVPFVL